MVLLTEANERCVVTPSLAALILHRAHASPWCIVGVKNISTFSCSPFFLLLIPFPSLFTPSSSWHWKCAKQNVDPDSLASVSKAGRRPTLSSVQRRAAIGFQEQSGRFFTEFRCFRLRPESLFEVYGKLCKILLFEITLRPRVSRQSNRIYLQRGMTCLMCLLVIHQGVKLFSEPPRGMNSNSALKIPNAPSQTPFIKQN